MSPRWIVFCERQATTLDAPDKECAEATAQAMFGDDWTRVQSAVSAAIGDTQRATAERLRRQRREAL